jgi:hypothetical protein
LFNSTGQHIANVVGGYLYAPGGGNIGRYLEDKQVFIGRDGKYLGEMFGEHRLLRKSSDPYADKVVGDFGKAAAPIPEERDGFYFGQIGIIVGYSDIPEADLKG